ncbi:Polysaccharide deacetylase [Arenibacter nanhaiticus]|uniref:Polysaccharide deacetylase n=1 Tax=Arenibacter nanhaiticus TaxID=558155 RepID=A0A1M6KK23_9FLAO|nr:polysaccharide deacetylase family protein [Arenibacter nanhaiticus]SHJ59318.1 Polysaccharide deacetylase [Arenibacter nanhaiticus]
MNNTGKFVISLDFELLWGMRDEKTIAEYGENILGVWKVIPRMLDLFEKYEVSATFATVGFLLASDKEGLMKFFPKRKPQYKNPNLSPYNGHFHLVKDSEAEDKYHYASDLINLIRKYPNHEIATHTFSHYYCNAEGQTIEDFRSDIKSAISIGNHVGICYKSLIFPRNMFNEEYLKVCEEHRILAYRGNEIAWCYRAEKGVSKLKYKSKQAFRLLDSYINLTGHHCYSLEDITKSKPYNIPSSRFLRPYAPGLRALESFRKKRILDSMTFAAKNNLLYHLWWHPHNFGSKQDENFNFLEDILVHYKKLNEQYGFESITMGGFAEKIQINHE